MLRRHTGSRKLTWLKIIQIFMEHGLLWWSTLDLVWVWNMRQFIFLPQKHSHRGDQFCSRNYLENWMMSRHVLALEMLLLYWLLLQQLWISKKLAEDKNLKASDHWKLKGNWINFLPLTSSWRRRQNKSSVFYPWDDSRRLMGGWAWLMSIYGNFVIHES